jgi:hypothetical protein
MAWVVAHEILFDAMIEEAVSSLVPAYAGPSGDASSRNRARSYGGSSSAPLHDATMSHKTYPDNRGLDGPYPAGSPWTLGPDRSGPCVDVAKRC